MAEIRTAEEWRTAAGWAAEAAAIGIDPKIMPNTDRCVRSKAARESWPSRPRAGAGGGVEYPLSALPESFRRALARHALKAAVPAPAQLTLDLPSVASLKTYQRTPMEARAAVLAEIDRLVLTMGLSRGKAVETLIDLARRHELAPGLQQAVIAANARGNADRALSRATVYNWLKARDQAGGAVVALAPVAAPELDRPDWAPTLVKLWCRPTKRGIPEILEGWPAGEAKPSYDQVRRYLKKLDALTRNRGRMGPRLLKTMQAYIARDTSELWPGAVFIGDGHTFKREVAHPIHGRPFRPEVTVFLDVYTRRWVGWSAALAENTWSVADALRHAITTTTCCDIVYYDNGSGAKNKTWDDDVTGLIARLSITKLHSAPWSSQARGIVERFHSSVLHKVARRAVTYVGQRMDPEALQRVFKATRKQIATTGASPILTPWRDFIAEIDAEMAAYNSRPHESLPKSIDPETGKRRHLTPAEMWDLAVLDGWQADPITEAEAVDLFRPAVIRQVSRGLVQVFDNAYFHDSLRPLHGEKVVVGFDLHDAGKVWVRLMDGRFVCEAIWNGHKRAYLPISVATRAQEKRVEGKLARLDKHRDTALAELPGGAPPPEATPLTPEQAARLAAMEAEWEEVPPETEVAALLGAPDQAAEAPATPVGKPADTRETRFARALALEQRQAGGEAVDELSTRWLAVYRTQPEYRAMAALYADFGDAVLTA